MEEDRKLARASRDSPEPVRVGRATVVQDLYDHQVANGRVVRGR
jgi:hypothetical protein